MQEKPAGDAWLEAQRIALAPIVFQAARLLRDLGILAALREHRAGLTIGEIVETVGISRYGVVVLIEAGLAAGLVRCDEDRFFLTPTGFVLLTDESTRVNMNVVQECCYQSAYYLEDFKFIAELPAAFAARLPGAAGAVKPWPPLIIVK